MPAMTTERPGEVFSGDAAFANSAAANTTVDLDITEVYLERARKTVVTVRNPSAVTALTVTVKNVETLGGAVRYPTHQTWTVAANTTSSTVVDAWLLGDGGRVSVSNNTALGVADAFTANVRVRVPQG